MVFYVYSFCPFPLKETAYVSSSLQKIGLPEVCLDKKYQSNELRVRNRNELIDLLTTKMGERTNEEWKSTFDGAGFPYGPVNNLSQVFEDPQVKHLGLEQTVSHATVGEIKQVGPPVKFSASSNRIQFAPPTLGSHTREVLADLLNLDEERLNELSRKGVINPWPDENKCIQHSPACRDWLILGLLQMQFWNVNSVLGWNKLVE